MQLFGKLLLGVLHLIGHMIYMCLHDRWSLCLDFLLLKGCLWPYNNIVHHVGMMRICAFNGDIRRLSQLSVRRLGKCLKQTNVFCTAGMQFNS